MFNFPSDPNRNRKWLAHLAGAIGPVPHHLRLRAMIDLHHLADGRHLGTIDITGTSTTDSVRQNVEAILKVVPPIADRSLILVGGAPHRCLWQSPSNQLQISEIAGASNGALTILRDGTSIASVTPRKDGWSAIGASHTASGITRRRAAVNYLRKVAESEHTAHDAARLMAAVSTLAAGEYSDFSDVATKDARGQLDASVEPASPTGTILDLFLSLTLPETLACGTLILETLDSQLAGYIGISNAGEYVALRTTHGIIDPKRFFHRDIALYHFPEAAHSDLRRCLEFLTSNPYFHPDIPAGSRVRNMMVIAPLASLDYGVTLGVGHPWPDCEHDKFMLWRGNNESPPIEILRYLQGEAFTREEMTVSSLQSLGLTTGQAKRLVPNIYGLLVDFRTRDLQ